MSRFRWVEYVKDMSSLLGNLSFRLRDGKKIGVEAGFQKWSDLTLRLRKNRGTVFLVGNGASASMSSHMAADLAKNARLRTEVFSDLSLITAISNDIGYDQVFAEPLSRRARAGDMLVAISSSGKSRNVLEAVKVATASRMNVFTLSAMKPDNPLRSAGSINIYLPANTYGYAESCHATVLHHWLDRIVEKTPKRERRISR